jgi:hypothetical protein
MQDAKTFQGTLGLGGDVDWHTFLGSWPEDSCAQNNVDPRFEFKLTAGDSVRLCVFFNCVFGMDPQKIEVPTCMDGAMQVDSPDDGEGCCSLNDFRVDFNCTGVDDESAQVNLRLDGGPDDECSPYTVSYDYIPKN